MPRPRKTGTPAPLEAHLGFWLRFVSNHVSVRFRQLLEAQGVTVSEWVALRTLWSQDGCTHAGLTQALGVTKGAASKVVSRLEGKGLALRRPGDGGSREQGLHLTAAGRALVPRLAGLADANDAFFFAHLPDSERSALLGSLQALVQHHALQGLPSE